MIDKINKTWETIGASEPIRFQNVEETDLNSDDNGQKLQTFEMSSPCIKIVE